MSIGTPITSTPQSGMPFYIWEVPGKMISIQLHFDVVDRISQEVMRGFGALPRRGAEVGGVLLGTCEPGFKQKVTIEDFEAVPCEYLQGPSYLLSDTDRLRLEDAIRRHQPGPDRSLSVVGFFRSHTRNNLFLDEADIALLSRYFSDPASVFLVVKPFATRPAIGGFFFWEDGEINRDASYQEFPFHRKELGGGDPRPTAQRRERERPDTGRDAVEEPVPGDSHTSSSARSSGLSILSLPELPPRPKKASKWAWLLLPVFLAVAAVGAFSVYQWTEHQNAERQKADAPPPSSGSLMPLKLTVVENQNQLDVSWDRSSPVILGARRGVLHITDGAAGRDLELSAGQLRNGRVLYSRFSGDVTLRLEVYANQRNSVSESIRVISQSPVADAPGREEPEPASPPRRTARRSSTEGRRGDIRRGDSKRTGVKKAESKKTDTPQPVSEQPVEAVPGPTPPVTPAEPEITRPARRR